MKFIFGVVVGLLIPAAIGYGYFKLGYAPVATASAPMPFEETIATMALRARMQKEAPKANPPVPADDANLSQGAGIYVENCAFCHGLPNQKATMAAKGMFPLPPQLFSADEMVTHDRIGGIYWKVANGIRMTGMPGFGEMLSSNQVWQVSLLLKNANKLPPQAQSVLSKTDAPATPAQAPAAVRPGRKK